MAQIFTNSTNRSKKGGPAQIIISSDQIDRQFVGTVTDFNTLACVRAAADGGGFTEAATNSFVDASVPYDCGISLKELQQLENARVTFQLTGGAAYTMRDAWFAGTSTGVGSDTGQITLRFESEYEMEETVCQE